MAKKLSRFTKRFDASSASQVEQGFTVTDRQLLDRLVGTRDSGFRQNKGKFLSKDRSKTKRVRSKGRNVLAEARGLTRSRLELAEDQRLTAENFQSIIDTFGQEDADAALGQFTTSNAVLSRVEQNAQLTQVRETAASISAGTNPAEAKVAVLGALEDAEERRAVADTVRLRQRLQSQRGRAIAAGPSATEARRRLSRPTQRTSTGLFSGAQARNALSSGFFS